MPQKHKKIIIGKRKTLVENLLLIEGISRAGKFLLANLLPAFDNIEPVQYHSLLEQIPFLQKFGFIDRATAQEILHYEVDLHTYEMLIGRNFNHRRSDKSSIFNHPKPETYLTRMHELDGDIAIQKFYKQNPYCLYIAHELLPNIGIYFDTFPSMKVISIQRSPLDLVYSWYRRGFVRRWGTDPKALEILFSSPRGPIPWFAAEWKKNYYELPEVDRIIMAIETLVNKGSKVYKKLHTQCKKQILFIRYEDVVERTGDVIKKIGVFLKKNPNKHLERVIAHENLPYRLDSADKDKRINEIQKHASKNMFKKLLLLENKYWTSKY